jgi:hypothetical protein
VGGPREGYGDVSSGSPVNHNDQIAFDTLQAKLVALWRSIERLNQDPQTVVVVPSIDVEVELTASQMQAYEERYLFLLLLLRQPRAEMVYVTGQPIPSEIVDYYLDLMPGVISSHARRRLHLVSAMEATARPLSRKLLERPRLLDRIRGLIPDPDRAHVVPFMATREDRELALRLGIPMYGTDPDLAGLGTKSAGRRLFQEVGVEHPPGASDLREVEAVVDAIADLRHARPELEAVVIKTDASVAGFGNTIVSLESLPDSGSTDETEGIRRRLDHLVLETPGMSAGDYFEVLARTGGIVEEMVTGDEIRSPSAQMRVTPLGKVELLSTHDQILGGASGQVFTGSRFPADPAYAAQIGTEALKVGNRLAEHGVIGRFAVDFVVARRDGEWHCYAIEINLRKGGTTHPFLTLQFLTDGAYDSGSGLFVTPEGRNKFYVASDHLEVPGLEKLLPSDVLDIALLRGLHFDQGTQVGTVFHMLSAVTTTGQVGVTCVADSAAEAEERYEETRRVLAEEVG